MRVYNYLFLSFASFIFIVFITTSVYSQSEDVTYGGVAAPGHISASLGLTYGNTRTSLAVNTFVLEGKTNDYLLPEIDVEAGLFDRVSLELVAGYRKVVSKGQLMSGNMNTLLKASKTTDGLNSIMLGANIGIAEEHHYLPSIYIQNQFFLPKTGNPNFQNENLGYFATVNFENTLSDVTCLDYSLGAGADGNDPQTYYSFNLNPNFYVSESVLLYGDFSGTYVKNSSPVHFLDVGSTFYISNLFSLDLYVGNEVPTKNFSKSLYGAVKFCFDFKAF